MDTRTGYEQSRREQALLLEELADRERALRDTRIGSIQKWKNWREIRNFDSRNFREDESSKIILKMSNLFAVDNYYTFPVNQRCFLFLVKEEDCWDATKICSQIYGIRIVFQETFLNGLTASTSTTYSGMLNSRDFSVTVNIPVQASTGKPVTESVIESTNNLEPKWIKSQTSGRDHRLEF